MKDLKLLFINPCLRKNASYKNLPVGLASVMTFIDMHGYAFDLLDIDINEYDDAYVECYIKENKYDVILFGSIVTHYKWIKWLTKTIKQHQPDTKIVVGNSVGGSCCDVFMENVPADVVTIGEGEFSCLEVLNTFRAQKDLKDINGIAYRKDNGICKTPRRKACRFNDLPMVNWDFFDVQKYLNTAQDNLSFGKLLEKKQVSMPVSTARGCINKCTFCHHVFWDDPYRFRSPENVISEIRQNMEKYGATYINFWDDLSFASLGQVEKMVDAILASGLHFEWSAAIRTDLLGNPQKSYKKRHAIAQKMKRSGCTAVGFSLESGNKKILSMMKKHVEVEYFGEQIKLLKDVGITSNVSVVLGYPIETKETIQETFDMCLSNDIYPSIGYLLPLPYTGMYQYAIEHGYITDQDSYLESITERQDICLNMTNLSDKDITDAIKECAQKANRILNLGLDENSYIKTGGYKRHTNVTKQLDEKSKMMIELKDIKRNQNDFSFTYSAAL